MWLRSGVAVVWRRPAATAPMRPLAWEPPYAAGAANPKKKKEREEWKSLKFLSKENFGGPVVAPWLVNLTGVYKDSCLIPGLFQWVTDPAPP